MNQPPRSSRRRFLRQVAAASATSLGSTLLVPGSASADEPVAPSDRITLGIIGTGNQGFNDLRGFLGDSRVQVVALCDVNREGPGYWDGKVASAGWVREPGREK